MLLPFVPRNGPPVDYYAVLQISANAEPDTVERVYRMLAQRFRPGNRGTGNSRRFREVTEAYRVLSDPARRAQYDVAYFRQRRDRWRPLAAAAEPENEEHLVRLAILEVLCTKRRIAPQKPGLRITDVEQLLGRPREHLEFAVWFLLQKQFIERSGDSLLVITAPGVEWLECNIPHEPA
ncbi:MAG: DnaJ domain-containing protein [Bacteroidales bacterium]